MVCEDGDLLLQTRVEAHRGGVDEDAVYAGMLVCWYAGAVTPDLRCSGQYLPPVLCAA
jgi:hypothetical protein